MRAIKTYIILLSFTGALLSWPAPAAAQRGPAPAAAQRRPENPCDRTSPLGYTDTPMIPGLPWHVHDINRPHPPRVVPGGVTEPVPAPSGAIVLFDGKDLSKWAHRVRGSGDLIDARWKVQDGYVEVASGGGDLRTRESFGDIQLHLEWATPAKVCGSSQWRGNSGILLMGLYEIQVLDSVDNPTYADGQAGAIYGQWPPLVNASRPRGEWQSYDIVFEAPRFEAGQLAKPAYVTVFQNGVLVQDHQQILGPMAHRRYLPYRPHAAEEPLVLQDHDTPVRFRNIWIRRLNLPTEP